MEQNVVACHDWSDGPRPGKVSKVELAFTELKSLESAVGPIKIYHIKSSQPLAPGEYVLFININVGPPVIGQPGNHYDFGIDPAL